MNDLPTGKYEEIGTAIGCLREIQSILSGGQNHGCE